MTRGEALKVLNEGRNPYHNIDRDTWCEAFEMAIEALNAVDDIIKAGIAWNDRNTESCMGDTYISTADNDFKYIGDVQDIIVKYGFIGEK